MVFKERTTAANIPGGARCDGAATAIEANVGGELDQEEHQQTEDRGENYNDRD